MKIIFLKKKKEKKKLTKVTNYGYPKVRNC